MNLPVAADVRRLQLKVRFGRKILGRKIEAEIFLPVIFLPARLLVHGP